MTQHANRIGPEHNSCIYIHIYVSQIIDLSGRMYGGMPVHYDRRTLRVHCDRLYDIEMGQSGERREYESGSVFLRADI